MFRSSIYQRYLMREVLAAVLLVLLAFLVLFSFFNFVDELRNVGRADYTAGRAALFVALGLPGLVYELIPIAALIGSLYALSLRWPGTRRLQSCARRAWRRWSYC